MITEVERKSGHTALALWIPLNLLRIFFESESQIKWLNKGVRGSVRSGSGLSLEGCNFSRFLKSGFEWLNMFQLLYYDVVREDFTKKSPDHLF